MQYLPELPVEVVLFAGVAAVGLGITLLLTGPRWRARHGKKIALIVFLGLLAMAGLAAVLVSASLAVLPLGLAGFWLLGWVRWSSVAQAGFLRLWALPANHYVQASLLILLGFGSLFAWSGWQDAQVPMWAEEGQKQAFDIKPPTQVLSQSAQTDRGNPISLRVPEDNDASYCSTETEEQHLTQFKLSFKLIRTAAASLDSNCHGWTFAAGKYWLSGEDVDRILEDNGYRSVSVPRPGDVIVYRAGDRVMHTGVVSVVTSDGTILVESKWGQLGRFLHRPADQTYSTQWLFYRSPRIGHLLRNLPDGRNVPPVSPAPGRSVI